MKLVLCHSGKYFSPIWAKRTKNKIVAYWDRRFSIVKLGQHIEDAHFTYPEDGDFHYTFYTSKKNNTCIRQFCDRIQYVKNGAVTCQVNRTSANEVFEMQPQYPRGWKKLPLSQFDGKYVNLILPIFGFGLPFNRSAAKNIFY